MNIGKRIKSILENQGKSISWLSGELNTNEKTFANKLRRGSIEAAELLMIAHLLKINLNELSGEYYLSTVKVEEESEEEQNDFIERVYDYEELKQLEGKEIPEINMNWIDIDVEEEVDYSLNINGVSVKNVKKCIVDKVSRIFISINLYDIDDNLLARFLVKKDEKLFVTDPKRIYFMNTRIRKIARETFFEKVRIK